MTAVIKQEEDLSTHTHVINQWECVAEELEEMLQEREVLDDLKLDRELESLASRESDLTSCEASLEVKRKNLEDARLKVLSRELAAEVHEANQRTQAVELADRERPLAKRQMRELATT
jgi:DNA repair exonuclease SbcCD ATPase subunit